MTSWSWLDNDGREQRVKSKCFFNFFLKSNRHPVDLATLPARVRLLRPMGNFCGSGHGPEGTNGRSRKRCTARACAVTDRSGALTSSKGGRRMIWVLQKKFFGSRPACLLSLRPHLGQFWGRRRRRNYVGNRWIRRQSREMLMIWVKSGAGEKMLSPFQAFTLTKF